MTKDEKNKFSRKGLDVPLPKMESFPTQFKNYKITICVPEYTSICPKTGLPDFGVITLTYIPNQSCVELKSFKYYVHAYRNIGIFYENAVNRILKDFISVCKPKWVYIKGEFTPRGGITTTIEAEYGKV
ncbi:MAG: NADPH-dependent 7-cyano-7-deazaguanine reductase QueF [Elusimicrobia bacterium RIFCSPLOWO2_02_FULL_39_32]|nr:MAG: NADPH-dependent 7-cyano-7-deazaguanine reductase QueF [Elusimicrobia bacterium RIFCSPHIGHO2_02_FULL_39_36]OGR92567.1 MAG: NADPH-dependent 7-cyano-7-deazaguanine reductase QueF [Elusimicrobia bacterium RIFCSPLOWO2_02_FULL_39_32]OGR99215.1 MAG: NADPH-dependent 7-cyano-7-deazaguanine reductase QueF [Elusimicrobia bacterium RIFCSPLOWO2_12_FULL_39_28]